jgi:hypothetical protein
VIALGPTIRISRRTGVNGGRPTAPPTRQDRTGQDSGAEFNLPSRPGDRRRKERKARWDERPRGQGNRTAPRVDPGRLLAAPTTGGIDTSKGPLHDAARASSEIPLICSSAPRPSCRAVEGPRGESSVLCTSNSGKQNRLYTNYLDSIGHYLFVYSGYRACNQNVSRRPTKRPPSAPRRRHGSLACVTTCSNLASTSATTFPM